MCMCLSKSYLQTLGDKREGAATVPFRPERAGGAGKVNEVVWWGFIEVW
jgi:hypothetical protein